MIVIERESGEAVATMQAKRSVVAKDEEVANAKAAEAKALKDEVSPMADHVPLTTTICCCPV